MMERVSGPTAKVLEEEREHLNARVRQASRRFRGLDEAALREVLVRVLVPLGDRVHASRPESLRKTVLGFFDAALNSVGRHLHERCDVLLPAWDELLVAAGAEHVARAPRRVIRSISNAVLRLSDDLSEQAAEGWVGAMAAAAPHADNPGDWLALGQVAAWRAGMAHYREACLPLLETLPEAGVAAALRLPEQLREGEALPRTLRTLAADRWYHPGEQDPASMTRRLRVIREVGGFTAFGGPFRSQVRLRAEGEALICLDEDRALRLFADAFGAVLRPTEPPTGRVRNGPMTVNEDGEVSMGSATLHLPELRGAADSASSADTLLVSRTHSYRLVLLADALGAD